MNTEEEILNLKKEIEAIKNRVISLEGKPVVPAVAQQKKLSIKEFILTKFSEGNLQKTLLIGYYFEKYEGFGFFNIMDLEQGFRDAKEPLPSNISDTVSKLINKGWLMKNKEKKDNKMAWLLTNAGEKIIENNFEKDKKS